MKDEDILNTVHRRTRRRLSYALVILCLYFAYLLNYLTPGDLLGERLGSSAVTGSLAMFAGLILAFIALELMFLGRRRDADDEPR